MQLKYQDDRAEKLANLVYHLSDDIHDEGLAHHMVHGGLPVPEAMIRLEIMLHKSSIANHHRKAVRRWQRHQNISGIVWNHVEYCGYSVEIPTIDDCLDATKIDRKILKRHVPITLDFLDDVQKYFKCWKYMRNKSNRDEYPWVEYPWDKARKQLAWHDWLTVSFHDYISEVHIVKNSYKQSNGVEILELDGDAVEQPRTEFTIFAGFAPSVCVEQAGNDCAWFELNNDRPSC